MALAIDPPIEVHYGCSSPFPEPGVTMSSSASTSAMFAIRAGFSDPSAPPSEPGREEFDGGDEMLSDPAAPPSEPGREEADGDDTSVTDPAAPPSPGR
jgi:hypothetical protein